jgi:hypothetical protein
MVMLHVPVTETGTEHIVQVINVFISFPVDLDDRSSCIFPSKKDIKIKM